MNSRRRLYIALFALVAAVSATSSSTHSQVLPPAGQCAPIGTLNCFDPSAQNEMWRTLDQIGQRIRPNLHEANEPNPGQPESAAFGEGDEPELNSVGDEIWYSTAESLQDAFTELNPGECTFAHLGDDASLPRQCKAANGAMVPPPAGRLFYPSGIAVDGTTIYVADRMNHRVTTMRFDGTAFDIAHPIGNGAPGDGSYGRPGDAFVYQSGVNGTQLDTPNGVAVDGAHRVLVADGGNGRVAVFNADGSPAFASHIAIPPGIDGSDEVTPTSVAISPGAVVLAPGSAPGGAALNHRIVVVDRYKCALQIYDTAFNHLRTLPERMPRTPGEGACVSEGAVPTPVGEFSLITGAAVDRSGNIFVSDAWNNRIVVYNRDGDLVGQFGDPGPIVPGVESPVDTLRTPSAVIVDSRDRVVVADSDNVRLAFFRVEVTDTVRAAFQFEVATSGDEVEGMPTGIAEQRGPAPSLDPAGRYLRIDTGNHKIQRHELADLAIVREAVGYTSNTSGTGQFAVAVPVEKEGAVRAVVAAVQPPPGVIVTNFRALPPALSSNPAAGNDIPRGTWVQYAFDFQVPVARMAVDFTITASGNKESGQATTADPVDVTVRGACDACDATATAYNYPVVSGDVPTAATLHTVSTGAFYDQPVFVRLEPNASNPPVQYIEWSVRGTEMPVYGARLRVSELSEDAPFVDIPFSSSDSILTYRAVTSDNTVGPERTFGVRIDPDGPVILFDFFDPSGQAFLTPPSGVNPGDGSRWWNTDVRAAYTVSDQHSGTAAPGGTIVISGEGRNLSTPVTATDRVGHSSTTESNVISAGGQLVNIDRTGPVITPPANLTVVAPVGGAATVPAWFTEGATAVDHVSGVRGAITAAGPATVSRDQTVTWTFTASDHAGNTSRATATVTAASSALAYTGATSVEYGTALALGAALQPASAAGRIKFTLIDPLRGNREAVAALNAGTASASVSQVLANVGSYQLRVEYVGEDLPAVSVVVPIRVNPAPFSIDVRPGQGKEYGQPDPAALTYHLPMQPLHPGDVLTGALTRQAGENAGSYTIGRGTLSINGNYELIVHSQPFTISGRAVTVRADDKIKVPGQPDPIFTYTVVAGSLVNNDAFTGRLTRRPGESLGSYQIFNDPAFAGRLSLGPNYVLTVQPGTLTIASNLPGNIAPVAGDDKASTVGAAPIDIAVLDNDTDANGDALSIHSVTQPAGGASEGVATLSGNLIKFTPAPGFAGTAAFSYTVTDQRGGVDVATVTVSVTAPACTPGTIVLHATNGGSGHGAAGNTRTFSGAGVQVKVTAWSREKSLNGKWAKAYLGAFGAAGLGVTDGSEGSGSDDKHKVDNVGERLNFVMFEFSRPVPIGRAFLTFVGNDSDISVWMGHRNDPFTNRLTLSDALLAGLGMPQMSTATNRTDRWASFNAAGATANVLVIAADVTDATPDDEFKIARLDVQCGTANRSPVAVNDTLQTARNTPRTMSVIANDSDPDGDTVTLETVTQPAKGSVVMNANGTLKYTPPANWAGTTSFTYTISDGKGGRATATVSVTVSSNHDDDDDDHDHDHDRDCDREHVRGRYCNDNRGWYNWRYR